MSRFNLIDEKWISVLSNEDYENHLVSIRDLFKNASTYESLAGDTKTQDFAVLRVLLAILHTVFSRFDAAGNPYECLEIGDDFRQKNELDNDDREEYSDALIETWSNLWKSGEFPSILFEYLDKWYDRFYLFDDKYPFFQVTEEDIAVDKISKTKASKIHGKNINRLISESGNKVSLFSPKFESKDNKSILREDELARWLITFQGYSGLSDKVIFGTDKYKASKGWLFDLGGITLSGKNLFETLLLNLVLSHPEEQYIGNSQKPCWEFAPSDVIERNLSDNLVDNIAELYTSWARAIYIDPDIDLSKAFSFDIVKLKDLPHQDQFLEPMTLWRYNENGENKDSYTPRKHTKNKSLWRSFGLISHKLGENDNTKIPGLIEWLRKINENKEIFADEFFNQKIPISAISMEDDGNATSWVPTDEIYDILKINDKVLNDLNDDGWIVNINDVVDKTKEAVEKTYRHFLLNIKDIRNIKSNDFLNREIEEVYFLIDGPFKDWISSIKADSDKNDKIFAWNKILKNILKKQADSLVAQSSVRDYKGVVTKDNKMMNIATAYNSFSYFLNKTLKVKEEGND